MVLPSSRKKRSSSQVEGLEVQGGCENEIVIRQRNRLPSEAVRLKISSPLYDSAFRLNPLETELKKAATVKIAGFCRPARAR